jgi:hypothetical protein
MGKGRSQGRKPTPGNLLNGGGVRRIGFRCPVRRFFLAKLNLSATFDLAREAAAARRGASGGIGNSRHFYSRLNQFVTSKVRWVHGPPFIPLQQLPATSKADSQKAPRCL